MKKSVRLILTALITYAVLLALLVRAESASPEATILTFWDAVWFSLITMTTVGYGDLSPVTPLGRVLGLVFALCSIGLLTTFIGIGLKLISGQLLPAFRLRLSRDRRWYVFSREDPDAVSLAGELRSSDPGCLLVFPAEEEPLLAGRGVIRINADVSRLLQLRGGQTEGMSLFFLGEDPWENLSRAGEAAGFQIPIYCMADISDDSVPEEVRLFGRFEALARNYWKGYPLGPEERTVVLIGCGRAGSAVLERAVLTNVFGPDRRTEYHIFDDTSGFAALHPRLMAAMAPGTADEDSLIFHAGLWTDSPELLARADRIILCSDEDGDNYEIYGRLVTWFPLRGQVHLRLSSPMPGLISFGAREDILTPEHVMKDALNRWAVTLNDIYNEGSSSPTAWRDLSWFLRQSNIAAADHLIVKVRYLLEDESVRELTPALCGRAYERYRTLAPAHSDEFQEMEHRRWMRFHWLYNWEYDPVRSNPRRRHPMLIPYGDLSAAEQAKDAYAWEMLGRLAEADVT